MFDALAEEMQSPSEGAPLEDLDMLDLAAHLFDTGALLTVLAGIKQGDDVKWPTKEIITGALPGVKMRNREELYRASQMLQRCAGKRQRVGGADNDSAGMAAPSGALLQHSQCAIVSANAHRQ